MPTECDAAGPLPSFDEGRALRALSVVILAAGLVVSLLAVVLTWRQPILDSNSFRQTQTALTSYWIAQGGPIFAYETPTLGAPWAIPFEFPLYQVIVAVVHELTRLRLDAAGRLVSFVFYLATLWQLFVLLRRLGGSRYLGSLACGLMLLSPLYVFWSRTFMMESTALFLSVAFLTATVAHVQRPRAWTAAALPLLATAGALVKVTTFFVFGIAAALVVAWDLRRSGRWRDIRSWLVGYAPVVLAGLVALVAVAAWVHYADNLKAQNTFGRNLTSASLDRWNYGTLQQRLDPQLWLGTVFGRAVVQSLGSSVVLGAVLLVAIAFGRAAFTWLALLVSLYMIPFLFFTNVHWVHHYYQYANALFLVAAIAIVAFHARVRWQQWVAAVLVVLTVACQTIEMVRVEWPQMRADQGSSNTMLLRRWLRRLPADGVVIVFGYDWSSEVAYYSKHRTISVPLWASRAQLESLRDRPELHTGGRSVVGVVVCAPGDPALAEITSAIVAKHTVHRSRHEVGTCTVWR